MVTVVTKTIGTASRDYSTLQAWEDAAPANLVTADQVWRGECYADAEFSAALTVSGSTVDATRYKELTVAAGQSFADHANKMTNALRYNASNGAGLRSTTAWGTALTASESYFRISRLQIYQDSSNGHALTINNQGAVVDGVISETRGGRALQLYSNGTAKNSLFVSRRASASEVADIWDGCSVANCTFAVPSDIAAATRVIRRSYWSGNTFTNCGFFGGTDAVSSATGATFSNCYTNDSTSIPSGCTTVAYDTSTGSGFENISNGTHDYRIKSTSALKDAGTSTGAPSVDIVGTSRPQGGLYDVGVWEFASGGPATITATTSLTAAIQLAQQLSASTSVAVQASRSVSTTVQTAVQAATAASAQLDAAVAQARTATASLEVAVRAAATETASLQPVVQDSAQQTASLQAAVQQARTATAALDLAAQAAAQQTATLAAYVQAGSSLAASANAAVQAAAQDTASASVAVQSTVTSTASLAAAIATARTASTSLEAAVQAAQSAIAGLSAQVQAGATTVAALDAAVRAAAQASSAVQAAVAVVTTTSAGLNAAVAMQRAVSAAADAAIFVRRIASAAMSAYIQFGGYVPTGSIAEAVYVPASLKVDVPPDGQYIYVE